MNSHENENRELGPVRWAELGIHPGAWFVENYHDVTVGEKRGWIDLLTLAIASFPSGRIGFCSERQLAATFGLDDRDFASVLRKAQGLSMAEVCNKAIVPYYVDRDDDVIFEIPDKSKYGIRYKELAFPGLYTYYPSGRISIIGQQAEHLRASSEAEKEIWDAVLKDALSLLRGRMERGLNDRLSPLITRESPLCSWSNHILPRFTHFVPDTFDVQTIVSGYRGLAIWGTEPEDLHRVFRRAWIDLEFWIRRTLSKGEEQGFPLVMVTKRVNESVSSPAQDPISTPPLSASTAKDVRHEPQGSAQTEGKEFEKYFEKNNLRKGETDVTKHESLCV